VAFQTPDGVEKATFICLCENPFSFLTSDLNRLKSSNQLGLSLLIRSKSRMRDRSRPIHVAGVLECKFIEKDLGVSAVIPVKTGSQ
jgi:hypothetical protein